MNSENFSVIIFFIIAFFIGKVLPVALQGPSFTRYDPCGLGVVQFDKTMTDNVWIGIVNLGLYFNLSDPKIDIHFKERILLVWTTANSTIKMEENNTHVTLSPLGVIPKSFIFYLVVMNRDSVPVVSKFMLNNETLCSEKEKAAQTADSLDVSNKEDNKSRHICGRRSMDHTELVTIGSDAKDGEWPWHVAIYVTNAENFKQRFYECGGSIVSRTAVITAGHCVTSKGINTEPYRVIVVAGTTNITNIFATGIQRLIAKDIIIHPCYTDDLPTADLAVIRVDSFTFNEFVQPICIWGPSYEKTQLFGIYATMVGFGKTENDTFSNTLRTVTTMIQNDETCIAYAPKLYPRLLNEFSFCAGYGPKVGINPRNGDSGGGLTLAVQQSDHKLSWFLRGVLSKCGMPAGAAGCDPTFYVVYTDVAPHYSWIFHHAGLSYQNNILNTH